jgi:hypothetical protein
LSLLSVGLAGVQSSPQRSYNQQSALSSIHLSRYFIEEKVASDFDFVAVSPKILIGFPRSWAENFN